MKSTRIKFLILIFVELNTDFPTRTFTPMVVLNLDMYINFLFNSRLVALILLLVPLCRRLRLGLEILQRPPVALLVLIPKGPELLVGALGAVSLHAQGEARQCHNDDQGDSHLD